MRRLLPALVLSVLAAAAVALQAAPTASADGGPHGNFSSPSTASCAGCHRLHTAEAPKLLAMSPERDLCLTCHGASGRGANSDVENGVYHATRGAEPAQGTTADNAPLLGGGFVNYQGKPVTSVHDSDQSTAAAWGNGVNRGKTADLSGGNLSCTTCHNPHGSTNYRLLRTNINGKAVTVQQVDEGDAKNYSRENWGSGYSSLCGACHSSYVTTNEDSGSDTSLLQTGGFSHRVDMSYQFKTMEGFTNRNPETVGYQGVTLPLAQSGSDSDTSKNIVTCATCHAIHGTSARMTGFAAPASGKLPGQTSVTDSALLRLDNRGVCQVCHQVGMK